MIITVLGARGRTGNEVVEQALAAGHKVNALIRNGSLPEQKNLNVFIGDATDSMAIVNASNDSDVIVSTLGATSAKSTLMSDSVKAVIAASESTGVERFILMSSFVVQPNQLKSVTKLMTGMMGGMVSDKTNSEELVRKSNLDWTIVYPTVLTNQPKGSGLRVVPENEKVGMSNKIARADVAAWILKEAEANAYNKARVTISK
jgi:putative NADH-flavin reductase